MGGDLQQVISIDLGQLSPCEKAREFEQFLQLSMRLVCQRFPGQISTLKTALSQNPGYCFQCEVVAIPQNGSGLVTATLDWERVRDGQTSCQLTVRGEEPEYFEVKVLQTTLEPSLV